MAEKKSLTSFDSVMNNLKARKFEPVYLLMGEESYYIDQITDYIAENALHEEERDFNQTLLYGADASAGQIVDMAKRFPMMAERQVVIVKEAQNIRNWERIEKYCEKPQHTTILVFSYKNGKIDGKKKVVKNIEEHGVVFESKKMSERELPSFITEYLKKHNTIIDNKSAQIIADSIGADLSRMTSELDKVVLSLPENNRKITPEIIEERIGVSKDYNGFEFRDAIAYKNIEKVNRILNYFDKNPKSGGVYVLLPMMFNYFQNLMLAHYAPQKSREEDIAKWLELKSAWQARAFVTGMRNYSAMKTMQIISKIREADAKTKGLDNPNTEAGDVVRDLVFFILH